MIVLLHLATVCCAAGDDGVYASAPPEHEQYVIEDSLKGSFTTGSSGRSALSSPGTHGQPASEGAERQKRKVLERRGSCSFKGRLDLVDGIFEFSLKANEGQVDLEVDRDPEGSYRALLDVESFHLPFFEMTTQFSGVLRMSQHTSKDHEFSGRFESFNNKNHSQRVPDVSGNLTLAHGVIHVRDLVWGGLKGSGKVELYPPYRVDAKAQLYGVDNLDILNLLASQDKQWAGNGEISGDIELSGTVNKLKVKANLVSQKGSIEDFSYDLLLLNLQGIYPLIDLTSSMVTKTDGFSVGLAGYLDLSHKESIATQIKGIKMVPFVNDNDAQSEWVLKRVQDSSGEAKTQTMLFLKNDKQNTLLGQEDSSLLGVQKKIGF